MIFTAKPCLGINHILLCIHHGLHTSCLAGIIVIKPQTQKQLRLQSNSMRKTRSIRSHCTQRELRVSSEPGPHSVLRVSSQPPLSARTSTSSSWTDPKVHQIPFLPWDWSDSAACCTSSVISFIKLNHREHQGHQQEPVLNPN